MQGLRWLTGLLLLTLTPTVSALSCPQGRDAPAEALTPHVSLLSDPERRLSLSDVLLMDKRFEPVSAQTLNFGYTKTAYWLRFTLSQRGAHPCVIELAFPQLDFARLYRQDGQGGWYSSAAGDTLPWSAREIPVRNLAWRTNTQAGTWTYYLEVKSSGSIQLPLTLWSEAAHSSQLELHAGLLGLIFGAVLAMVIYNGSLWLFLRDRSYLHYALYGLSFVVFLSTHTGVGFQYFWPDWPWFAERAGQAGAALVVLCAYSFARSFLETALRVPRLDRLVRWMMWLAAATLPLVLLAPTYWTAPWVTLLALSLAVMLPPLGFRVWQSGYRPAGYFFVAWMAYMVAVAVAALTFRGLLPVNLFTTHGLAIGGTLELLLLSIALSDRIGRLRVQRAVAVDRANALLKDMNEALERQVAERTSELLAAKEHAEALAAVDGLTGLLNHRTFAARLTRVLGKLHRVNETAALLVIDLDHFKQINDRWGHPVGDQVLAAAGQILHDTLRESDLAGRHGGDELMALLPSVNAGHAEHVAQRLVSRFAALRLPQEPDLRVTVSIGYALTDAHVVMDSAQLFRLADEALYAAKAAGRNCVRRHHPSKLSLVSA